MERIKLSHDHRGYGSGFFVDEVEVEIPSRQDRITFPCQCWLAQDAEDARMESEMFVTQQQRPPSPTQSESGNPVYFNGYSLTAHVG